MEDLEIIGAMVHFYIGTPNSKIGKAHAEISGTVSNGNIENGFIGGCCIEVAGKTKGDLKAFSIRSFENEQGDIRFLAGFEHYEDEVIKEDIENGLLKPITKKEYLAKYRGLDE